jgi:hypothetical protein
MILLPRIDTRWLAPLGACLRDLARAWRYSRWLDTQWWGWLDYLRGWTVAGLDGRGRRGRRRVVMPYRPWRQPEETRQQHQGSGASQSA